MKPPCIERTQIPEGPYDLAVIGGGINGVAIARDAGLRHKSVVLLERGDFGEGTSSRTSKLIHGGIRYLEHFRLGLVAESLRERALLLDVAPHLVRPNKFLLPVYEGAHRGAKTVRLGLFLYKLLAVGRRIGPSGFLDRDLALQSLPGIRPERLIGCGYYHDAVMDDARLVLTNALAALEEGKTPENEVTVRNHADVVAIRAGSPSRIVFQDRVSGRESTVLAHRVVKALGPWTDPAHLLPSKGVHLVFPAFPIKEGVLLTHSQDGRVFFVVPWKGRTVVGTTETPWEGDPGEVRAEPAEVSYLLEEVNRVFPGLGAKRGDILSTFAGVRPLARTWSFRSLAHGRVSRKHRIHEDQDGVLSVLGGKYTTYRSLARRVVDRLFPGTTCKTHSRPLPGGEDGPWSKAQNSLSQEIERFGADEVERLFCRYGTRLREVLAMVEQDPDLGQRLDREHPELRAEVVHAVRRELAVYPADFLVRRTTLRSSAGNGRTVYDAVEALFREHSPSLPLDLDRARVAYFKDLEREDALRAD